MKKILLVLCLLLCGCSSGDVNKSPESVIKNYMKAIVEKDEQLLKQCLSDDKQVSTLLDNDYNDFKMIKIQSLSDNQYAFTGLLNFKDGLQIPYLNTCIIEEKNKSYYIQSVSEYSDHAISEISHLLDSDVYKEYMQQVQTFLSKDNLDHLYKKVEDFKSSEQYEQYMNNLNEFKNSEQFQSTLESIKENTKDTYNQITSNLNDFVNSDQFKNMQEGVKDFFNSKEVQDFYNKISNMFK